MTLLDLPEPFQQLFAHWRSQGFTWQNAKWTSNLERHFSATMFTPDRKKCFLKMAIADQPDLDEKDMRSGLCREVWWSQVIQHLRAKNPHFPFVSPKVIDHNTGDERAVVVWILFEFEGAVPFSELRLSQALLQKALDQIVLATLALEEVHERMLWQDGVPQCPALPHGSRYYEARGQLHMETACLGNGAWELKNFYLRSDCTLVVMDNEFAGWYPFQDQFTYLYHRIYCNEMDPKLAKLVLRLYQKTQPDAFNNPTAFLLMLRSRLWRGFRADLIRRRIMPWHRKQRLRIGLWWHLWRRHDIKVRY